MTEGGSRENDSVGVVDERTECFSLNVEEKVEFGKGEDTRTTVNCRDI